MSEMMMCPWCLTVGPIDHICPKKRSKANKDTRVFDTGATRDSDEDKLDYEGFISPLVWTRFAEYMHEKRLSNIPPGEKIRSSDNWQKGIPLTAYIKSAFRHFMEIWHRHRNGDTGNLMEEALCALLFNIQGYLHELLKAKKKNG